MFEYARFAVIKNNRIMTKIFYIWIIATFILLLFTVTSTHIHKFEPSAFYYLQQLDVFYWIGLGMLIAAILVLLLMRIYRTFTSNIILDMACILVFVLYLFGTPVLYYDTPRFVDVYNVLDMTGQMIQNAGVTLSGTGGDNTYLDSFPGAIIFFSIAKIVSDISFFSLANLYVIYLMVMLSILLYIIVKRFTVYFMLIAPIGLLALSWMQEYHLSPQSLALILYLCLWFIVILHLQRRTIASYLAIGLLTTAITVSHPGTPIFIILNVLSLYVLLKVGKWLKITDVSLNVLDVAVLVLPFVLWLAFVAQSYLVLAFNMLSVTVFKISSNNAVINYTLTAAQPDQAFIDLLRKIITVAESIIGILCIAFLCRRETIKKAIVPAIWFISCFIFQIVGFAINSLFGRFLIFAILPLSILIALMISRARFSRTGMALSALAVILLVFSALLMPLISYGGDYYEFKPLSDVYVDNFIKSNDLTMAWGDKFVHLNILDQDLRQMYDIYAINTVESYNFLQVKYSKGKEYSAMFDNDGQSSIYDNGDSSLHCHFASSPSR
jgi:hypothetical protein